MLNEFIQSQDHKHWLGCAPIQRAQRLHVLSVDCFRRQHRDSGTTVLLQDHERRACVLQTDQLQVEPEPIQRSLALEYERRPVQRLVALAFQDACRGKAGAFSRYRADVAELILDAFGGAQRTATRSAPEQVFTMPRAAPTTKGLRHEAFEAAALRLAASRSHASRRCTRRSSCACSISSSCFSSPASK